jgi:hypothetical protein
LAFRVKPLIVAALSLCGSMALAFDARTNYILHCQGCHTADGSGLEDRVPNLRPTLVPFSGTPEGRMYLVQVPGVAQSPLSDAETAAVLNWMLRKFAEPKQVAGLKAFTEEEVARYRATRMIEVRATRARLLAEFNLPDR